MSRWSEAFDQLKAMVDSGVPVEQVERAANAKLDELIAADIAEEDQAAGGAL